MLPISYLFVPGDRPERFDKALAAGADAVIVDLEDAVKPEAKAAARSHLRELTRRRPEAAARLLVRINDAASEGFDADLDAVHSAGIETVVLSKTESRRQVEAALRILGRRGQVLALIETARGLESVQEICHTPGVQRLGFGTLDYALDLGLSGDPLGLVHPSSVMAIASRGAGIGSPVAGVTTALDDEAKLAADLAFARAFGFGAKLCIHPKQVAGVHAFFRPSDSEVDWAKRVVAAVAAGTGAVQVDGRMVDRPVLVQAESILRRAR